MSRRLANAAVRHAGWVALVPTPALMPPDVRGLKIKFRDRNRRSAKLAFSRIPHAVDSGRGEWLSMSSERVSGRSMAYRLVTNSERSMLSASPDIEIAINSSYVNGVGNHKGRTLSCEKLECGNDAHQLQ